MDQEQIRKRRRTLAPTDTIPVRNKRTFPEPPDPNALLCQGLSLEQQRVELRTAPENGEEDDQLEVDIQRTITT